MLSSEQVKKYAAWLHDCDSVMDAHGMIREDLGRDIEREELDQLTTYAQNGGAEAQIEVSCRNDTDASANMEVRTEMGDIYEKVEYDNVARMKELTAQIADTYRRKNADYGDSFGISVRKYGIIAALTRMSDKWNRLENLILTRGTNANGYVADESVLDTLCDMATYCLMTVMEIEKGV